MHRRRSRLATRPWQLATAAAILLAGVVVLAVAVRVTHSDRILPGVRVMGVGLGGLSEDEARRRLSSLVGELSSEPVILRAGDRRLTIAPEQAGYSVDLAQTAARALDSGRSGLFGGLGSTVAGLLTARDVPLAETIDRSQLERTVASAAGRLGSSSFAGELVIDPGTRAVSTKPPRPGREVDRRELAARLGEALMRRQRPTLTVPLRDVQVASREDVEAVGRAARTYLRESLRLTGAGDPLDVSPADIAGVLALESRQGGRSVRLGAGDRRLAAL
ncbi:MAG: peptidoglycan binding domain-containing protein, partial [Solirubrobacteraceae bacterium]|nr:peptidoglycan binding domain-containing protein [Solirubrobacteraceae bacterium]